MTCVEDSVVTKEALLAELRSSVTKMAGIYKSFMNHLGRYEHSTRSVDDLFKGKPSVDELVAKAKAEDRLLYVGDEDLIRYWWTHGECNLVAMMLETLLKKHPECEAKMMYVVDTEDEGFCAKYHALVRFRVDGEIYYADGLLYSQDYRELYRGDGLPPKEVEVTRWRNSLFYLDPCGLILFSSWCELFNIETNEVLSGWDHPTLLSGKHDLDEYYRLLRGRDLVLREFSTEVGNEVLRAYNAGK